ncbi:ArsR/SmtB family transcription factor [Halomicroarcula sp. GCM10025709]|uniref:ArsR/SmtB family transcription factor n=1 Tax=Haloarcula TaxID=2237 RepID=UPI0024C31A94|nr:winged helix-turn-helix domain-containing protein [Halomicroarcula sp. YJ-61-S]
MAQTHPPQRPDKTRAGPEETIQATELVALLDDEHAREIITAISEEAKAAREIVTECNSSRPTVYRRLNRLQEAGLVTTAMRYDSDGHHCKTFRLRYDSASIRLGADGLCCTVEASDS